MPQRFRCAISLREIIRLPRPETIQEIRETGRESKNGECRCSTNKKKMVSFVAFLFYSNFSFFFFHQAEKSRDC